MKLATLLASGSLWALLIQTSGQGLVLFQEIYISRLLGPERFGQYAWSISIFMILAAVSTLGLNTLLMKELPSFKETESAKSDGLVLTCNLLVLRVSVVLAILIALLGYSASDYGLYRFLPWIVLALPFTALQLNYQAVHKSSHRIWQALFPDIIVKPVAILLLCTLIYLSFPEKLSVELFLSVYVVSSALVFLVIRQLSPRCKLDFNDADVKLPMANWLHGALPLFGITFLTLLLGKIDLVILGLLSTSEEAGHFAAANRLACLLMFPLLCINAAAATVISRAYHHNGMQQVQNIYNLITTVMLMTTIPLSVLLVLMGPALLELFGAGFNKAYPVLLILIVGQVINSLTGSVALIMMMTGHHGSALKILMTCLFIALLLNLFLVPKYAGLGAAIATSASLLLWNLAMLVYLGHQGLHWKIVNIKRAFAH